MERFYMEASWWINLIKCETLRATGRMKEMEIISEKSEDVYQTENKMISSFLLFTVYFLISLRLVLIIVTNDL